MQNRIKKIMRLLSGAARKYGRDDPVRMAGNTAFFMIFALSPILIIIISSAGLVMDDQLIREKVYNQFQTLIGDEGTAQIREIISNYRDPQRDLLGTIVGIVIFLVASTTFFSVLQNSLNYIWRIRAKPRHKLLKMLKDRLLSFGLILSFGFIMLVTMLIDAGLSLLQDYLSHYLPDTALVFAEVMNIILSLAVTTLAFALIYKFLPDGKIRWNVTWFGAFVTALLFNIGRYLIGFGLSLANIGVIYGAAGSLVIILLWVFYASIIFFFGAEITQQYAKTYGEKIIPSDYAVEIKIKEVDSEDNEGA